ncbi:hypothetical protein FBY14_12626 [Azospirillum brasilense]|nr:hypothetical protein FBY14_12626 [Azospirillum brasilense]
MFAIGLDIGYSNLKLAYGEVPDSGTPKPAVTQVLPAGAGRLSDLPLRMGKADGDTDALVVNVNSEKWGAGGGEAGASSPRAMYLRMVLRSRPVRRAIADTDRYSGPRSSAIGPEILSDSGTGLAETGNLPRPTLRETGPAVFETDPRSKAADRIS